MINEKNELLLAELDCVQTEIHELQNRLKDIKVEVDVKGYICFRFVKCGKPKCHCNAGVLHGPYPHLQWWDKGKIKTKYLNRKNYPTYRMEIEKAKEIQGITKRLDELYKKERKLLRIIEK